MLNDKIIRAELVKKVNKYKNTNVVEELSLINSPVRADLVTINGHLTGYEIKSDLDSLDRLQHQCRGYDKSFEMNYLIVGEKLVAQALLIIPDYWGVMLALPNKNDNGTKLRQIRRAKLNPNFDFSSFLFLMPVENLKREIIPVLPRENQILAKKKIKQDLIRYVDQNTNLKEKKLIKQKVRDNIRKQPRVR